VAEEKEKRLDILKISATNLARAMSHAKFS
jgi:hypothetical protein